MKNKIFVIVFVGLSVGMFAGCGGEYASRPENEGVSGGAVSASAVSGQAVSDQSVSGTEKHLYSNDTNVYYLDEWDDDDEVCMLVERNLVSGAEKKMKMGGKDKMVRELLFVDNDWIYYDAYEENVEGFYRIPVEKKGEEQSVDLEKEELLFYEENGITGITKADHGPFCNGKWIAYATAEGKFCRYDINGRRSLPAVGESAGMLDQEIPEGVLMWMWQGEESAFYWLDGNSGELVKIPDETETYTNVYSSYPVSGVGVFLPDSCPYDEEDNPDQKIDMSLWHFPDAAHPEGWIEVIAEEDEIRSLLKDREDIDKKATLETLSVFVQNDTVYQQVSAQWEKGETIYRNMIILSYALNRGSEHPVQGKTLKVEKKLSQILENPKENQKKFLKVWMRARPASDAFFFSRGQCNAITEKYAFFTLSVKGDWRDAMYEFESGKLRFIDKKDPEWGILHQDLPLFEVYSDYMPDNGEDDLEG